MHFLLHDLSKLTRLSEPALLPILHYFDPVTARADTVLLAPNAISSSVWFVNGGILRSFYLVEERKRTLTEEKVMREVTNWIVPAGGFLTDIRSFLYRMPATCYIETLEASKLYSLSFDNYLTIQRTYPDIARAIFENTLVMADFRVRMCNLRDPESRLEMFENKYPTLKGRLSVNIQASYLNIDPTTLSRLRSRKK